MADCILMQLGSNLHWDQTCKTCKCMQSGMQDLHWFKLAKLAIPVSRLGPSLQPRNQGFWGGRRLIGLIYIDPHLLAYTCASGLGHSVTPTFFSALLFAVFRPFKLRPPRSQPTGGTCGHVSHSTRWGAHCAQAAHPRVTGSYSLSNNHPQHAAMI